MTMLLWFHIFFRSIIDDSGFVVSSVWPSTLTLLSCHTSTGNLGSRPLAPQGMVRQAFGPDRPLARARVLQGPRQRARGAPAAAPAVGCRRPLRASGRA